MNFNIQKLPKSQVEIIFEVSSEEFDRFLDRAVLDLGQNLEVGGFRKGKAPKEIIEKEISSKKIMEEAAEICVRENYLKVIMENKIEPLGSPEIKITKMAKGNPLEFSCKFSVFPEINLPDYKKIASETKKKEVAVTDDEIKKLKAEKERVAKERTRQEILEKIAEKIDVILPEVLVESEQRRMIENLKQQAPQMLRISFEDYLVKIGKTEKELLDSFSPEAQKRVKISLALREMEKRENIEAPDDEVEKEVNEIIKNFGESKDLDRQNLKEYAKEVIRNEKILQFLENLAGN